MNKYKVLKEIFLFKLLLLWSSQILAVDSGSTETDGAFNPTTSQVVDMTSHPNGIYNFTTINIPSGVTITFVPNAGNTPVILLASGDVVIDGTIDISGQDVNSFGLSLPGPGGYRGGRGGSATTSGANGAGPGGGPGGILNGSIRCGGSGGGYGQVGLNQNLPSACPSQGEGPKYGSPSLVPLFGGSGGAGGAGEHNSGATTVGGAGGAGGGALLIASTGTLTLNGGIIADGGAGQNFNSSSGVLSNGGGGSGGGVRLVATNLTGSGSIDVSGGQRGSGGNSSLSGGEGGYGRVRLEADNLAFSGTVTPAAAVDAKVPAQAIFPSSIPTLSIATVAGKNVPAIPNGSNDVVLPADVTNPVAVGVTANNVPLASVVTLTLTPVIGDVVTATASALAGTVASSTATASISLPQGPSILTASVSFSISVAMGKKFSPFAEGELVASMRLETTSGKVSETIFITATGKEYSWASNAITLPN